jgi:hypothetical protein
MRRHSEDIAKAAEMTLRGVPQKQIAAGINCSTKQIQRWAKDPHYEHLFHPPEPGSVEDLKRVHLEALEATLADGRPDHATRQRAAAELHKLGAGTSGRAGSQTIQVVLDLLQPTPRVELLDGQLEPVPPEDAPPHLRPLSVEEARRRATKWDGSVVPALALHLQGASPETLDRLALLLGGLLSVNSNAQIVYFDPTRPARPAGSRCPRRSTSRSSTLPRQLTSLREVTNDRSSRLDALRRRAR